MRKNVKITNKPQKQFDIIIENLGKQAINIQLKAGSSNDKLLGEKTIKLKKHEQIIVPEKYIYQDQLDNLSKNGFIRTHKVEHQN